MSGFNPSLSSGIAVTRATANLPQSTNHALFTITGGKVRILSIVGEVTTVIQTQANATKLTYDPSGAGSSIDLCATLDITAKAVGAFFTIVGVLATALKATSVWLAVPADCIPSPGIILGPGSILLDCAASNTGQIKWSVIYDPIDNGAVVTSA